MMQEKLFKMYPSVDENAMLVRYIIRFKHDTGELMRRDRSQRDLGMGVYMVRENELRLARDVMNLFKVTNWEHLRMKRVNVGFDEESDTVIRWIENPESGQKVVLKEYR